jgi:hypothetical protein
MPGIGPGCHELRIVDGQANWRIMYHIATDAVVILDVFMPQIDGVDLELAGAVRSTTQGARGLRTKAWFVAPRRSDAALTARIRELPGWDEDETGRVLAFEPGPVKSIGFSASDPTWTVYYKP